MQSRTYGAYRPLIDVAFYVSSNTMDITLSEAPNLLSNRPVLTPALISAQAFFLSGVDNDPLLASGRHRLGVEGSHHIAHRQHRQPGIILEPAEIPAAALGGLL